MGLGTLYKLIDRQMLLGQQCLNVYYYESQGDGDIVGDLRAAFIEDVLPQLRALQTQQVTHVRIDTLNVTTGLDYEEYTHPSPLNGNQSGETSPSFVAWGFRYNRASRDSRHGYKRIPGVGEGAIADGVPVAGIATPIANLAASLQIAIGDSTGGPTYLPRIVRRTGVAPLETYTAFPVQSVGFVRVTSQVSRRVGRGS